MAMNLREKQAFRKLETEFRMLETRVARLEDAAKQRLVNKQPKKPIHRKKNDTV